MHAPRSAGLGQGPGGALRASGGWPLLSLVPESLKASGHFGEPPSLVACGGEDLLSWLSPCIPAMKDVR